MLQRVGQDRQRPLRDDRQTPGVRARQRDALLQLADVSQRRDIARC
jgi:hypothetical protein